MDDLISRQAAIDALDKRFDDVPMELTMEILQLRRDLRELPSAQPEQKVGKWIEIDDGWDGIYYVCSECGAECGCPWTLIDGTPYDNGMHYCPNCGAWMKGETDDEGRSN